MNSSNSIPAPQGNKSALFLGTLLQTAGINERIAEDLLFAKFIWLSIVRHRHGDWGDCCPDDAAANDYALQHGERVFSVYLFNKDQPHSEKIWIITERDRSATTILFPHEY